MTRGSRMICELCLAAEATSIGAERLSAGRLTDFHYCSSCWAAKSLGVPPGEAGFPRPRLTLNGVMILVAISAIPNGLAAWLVRSRFARGSSEQMSQWTHSAFLTANACFGLVTAYVFLDAWLRDVVWYRRTGGIIAVPKPTRISKNQNLTWLAIDWVFGTNLLTECLTTLLRPNPLCDLLLFTGVSTLLLYATVRLIWNGSTSRAMLEPFWQEWGRSSGMERALKVIALAWPMGLFVILRWRLVPSRILLNLNPWLLLPGLLLIVLGSRLLFKACEAVVTRRR
jgi:hypothetical protein